MESNINVFFLPSIVKKGPAIKLPTSDARGGILPVASESTCYYCVVTMKNSLRLFYFLLIQETSESVSSTAFESSNDGIPGLDQARTMPMIMKDSDAAAAAPI